MMTKLTMKFVVWRIMPQAPNSGPHHLPRAVSAALITSETSSKNPKPRIMPSESIRVRSQRHRPSDVGVASARQMRSSALCSSANTLVAPTTSPYGLTAVDNSTDGATGLPVIAANDNLTILGNGDTIARSTAAGTPAFRLFDVATGVSLTLENLTLQGGLAFGSGVPAEGGGIYSQGSLDLNGVTVQNNVAQGANQLVARAGINGLGGGIYSSGSLTLEGGTTVQNNQALGGRGQINKVGGDGLGGGHGMTAHSACVFSRLLRYSS